MNLEIGIRAVVVAVAAAAVCSGAAHAGVHPKARSGESASGAPTVRVRIAVERAEYRLRGFDLRFQEMSGAESGGRVILAADRTTSWTVKCGNKGVTAQKVSGKAGRDSVVAAAGKSLRVLSPAGFLKFNGRLYRKELRFVPSGAAGAGKCDVVNVVALEHYLDGLVNSEFSSRWNEDAVAAQVIAARTYALYRIRENGKQHYDLDATVADQVYDGAVREHYKASRIVDRTGGLVLVVPGAAAPKPIKAFYHSVCGGRTQVPEKVWGREFAGFKRGVKCPHCHGAPGYSWRLELESGELESALRKASPPDARLKSARLRTIRIKSSDESGRVEALVAAWTDAAGEFETELTGVVFRDVLGPARLKSAAFEVSSPKAGRWRVTGRGFGHGVGLCQWGAKRMGEKGSPFRSILGHYYPDAVLKKLW